MIFDAILKGLILGKLAPVEALRPGALMMITESKRVPSPPSVCLIGRAGAGGAGVWKIPRGGSRSSREEAEAEKETRHSTAGSV